MPPSRATFVQVSESREVKAVMMRQENIAVDDDDE